MKKNFILAQRVERLEADSAADVIGIDLGTTNSAVAVFQNGAPRVLKNFDGIFCFVIFPSCHKFRRTTDTFMCFIFKRH